jgi:hypothetical protein
MSWEIEDDFICKLVGGLNNNGTIKKHKSYRRRLEYDIKHHIGALDGPEELEYEKISDEMTPTRADDLKGLVVERKTVEDQDQIEIGTIMGFVLPDDENHDARIRFNILWENGDVCHVPFEDLQPWLRHPVSHNP